MSTKNTFHIKTLIELKWRHNKREMKRKLNLEEKIKITVNITFNGKKAKCFSSKVKNKLMA